MKKAAMFMLIALFVLVSCGEKEGEVGSEVSPDKKAESSTKTKKALKKHGVLKINIGDEEKTFEDVDVKYDRRSDEVILSGGYKDSETGGVQTSTFQLSFKGKAKGTMKDASMTLRGYKVEEVSGKVDSLKTSKGTYGGTKVDSIKVTFKGTTKKLDTNGVPHGDPIPFEASFKK